ncbi:CaiF/GrlA family transcriptional regulator [Salmonella enterica]|nr:CaiF/GrlA family transcriptional regulator [Salmonella enterica]EDJ8883401.1 CaiF/GrlA family transcriptional regulator [Salmonella enterica subsp. diarizonae]EEJ4270219.1 CaiF/GrlA family transcriptional regulator [Salmonella enterica subsp. diarizonae serovar 50:r:z]EDR6626974.1 CaiF/GrlA family transcriptional regulator [Salmonella enterica subsp. diarizonae]EHW7943207.1 CaiF/GrlA family transcriptional regulator [Salmonella enterica]
MCPDNTHKKKPYTPAGSDIHYPGQTNHDACFIPESVRKYSGEPLYILVAYWCQQQKGWVQRNQISEAFHITARRASYLLAYLRNKAGRVDCEYRKSVLANKVSRYEILVTDVKVRAPENKRHRSSPPPVSRHRVGNADREQANKLWNRLRGSRNAGEILKKEKSDGNK